MAKITNKELLEQYVSSIDDIKGIDDLKIVLPKGQTSYEYVIISELGIGAKNNRPAIKKLLKQISYLKDNHQVFVVLGGNLISYTKDIDEVKKYVKVLSGALEPIKDRIKLAYYGDEEKRFEKAKEPLCPVTMLLKSLKLNPNKVLHKNGAVVNVCVQGANTGNTPVWVRDRFVAIKSTAQTFSAEGKNGYKMVENPGNFDNIFITCCNNSGVFRKAIMRSSRAGNNDQIEKHNFNVILDSGYKLVMKTPGGRIRRFNFVDKYSYTITPSINQDASRVVGKETLTEEKFKTFISRRVISTERILDNMRNLTNAYLQTKKANEFKAKWLCDIVAKNLKAVDELNLKTLIEQKNQIEKMQSERER